MELDLDINVVEEIAIMLGAKKDSVPFGGLKCY